MHGGGDGETQTGARLFAREHLLSIDSRCQSVNWTKKKKSAGRGGGGIKNASITNFLLFTYSKNELLEWEKENPGERQGSWAL